MQHLLLAQLTSVSEDSENQRHFMSINKQLLGGMSVNTDRKKQHLGCQI